MFKIDYLNYYLSGTYEIIQFNTDIQRWYNNDCIENAVIVPYCQATIILLWPSSACFLLLICSDLCVLSQWLDSSEQKPKMLCELIKNLWKCQLCNRCIFIYYIYVTSRFINEIVILWMKSYMAIRNKCNKADSQLRLWNLPISHY